MLQISPRSRCFSLRHLAVGFGLIMSGAAMIIVAPANVAQAAAPPGADEPLTLSALHIEGNKQVATPDIMSVVPFHVGDTVTQNQISKGLDAVQQLYKSKNVGGSFGGGMKFIGKKVEVTWNITEQQPLGGPVVDGVVFSGNSKISADALTAVTKLRPGSPVSNEAVQADQKAITDLYKSKNISASVGMTPSSPTPNHFLVTWTIVEK
ncbi:POTRA domain-containing protein [Acetobacter oeni]|uniref:POTRA domain-containing protein n=1 Tax=Acetobacter oeni TaxID=304077 RepID=A0A511XGN3_9PROT|nr:POTRA domain-containing protein [Acetobacter oeni]MBB3881715.1 outer membrane protein assembly factor BamA [Acetobacter oeni]GEN62114.1 hypothetical protein AOE01nite_03380 [Acetobacter oeni]